MIIEISSAIVGGIVLSLPATAVYSIFLNKKMHERMHVLTTRTNELKSLLDLSLMMEAAFDLDMTLNLVLLSAQDATQCQVCAIYLKETNGDNLELKAASGSRDPINLLPCMPMTDARCGPWDV